MSVLNWLVGWLVNNMAFYTNQVLNPPNHLVHGLYQKHKKTVHRSSRLELTTVRQYGSIEKRESRLATLLCQYSYAAKNRYNPIPCYKSAL